MLFIRSDQPASVVLVAEQLGEHAVRVETRQAKPVDGTVEAHQGRGLAITDKRVILNPGHT